MFNIPSKIENLRIVEKAVDELSSEYNLSSELYGNILIATIEAANNAILHGNGSNPEKIVDIEITFKSPELKIKVTDEGSGFSPEKVPDPTTPENIETLNGRGVYLMSRLADKIKFSKKGNSVTMSFKNILS